jgi:hypothetical protein
MDFRSASAIWFGKPAGIFLSLIFLSLDFSVNRFSVVRGTRHGDRTIFSRRNSIALYVRES